MILIFEPQCTGYEHADVNAAFIQTIAGAHPTSAITFCAEVSHIQAVKEALGEAASKKTIQFQDVPVPARGLAGISRVLPDISVIASAFYWVKKLSCERLYFSSTTTFTLFAIKAFLTISFRQIKTTIAVHGILESLVQKKISAFYWALTALNHKSIRLLVMSPHIFEKLISISPKLSRYTRWIFVPYLFRNQQPFEEFSNQTIKFGMIGVATLAKGADTFFRLASTCHESGRSDVQFALSGSMRENELAPYRNSYVTLPSQSGFLTAEEYRALIQRFDYVVFCYPKESYQLTASGAFFESASLGKPILCLRNPFFESTFKIFGNIGYMFETEKDMADFMVSIDIDAERSSYRLQRDNISKIKDITWSYNVSALSKLYDVNFSSFSDNGLALMAKESR